MFQPFSFKGDQTVKKLAAILSILGIVTLSLGFYYQTIKAGIPFQDPTPELYKEYLHYYNIGKTLNNIGLVAIILSIMTLILHRVFRFNSK